MTVLWLMLMIIRYMAEKRRKLNVQYIGDSSNKLLRYLGSPCLTSIVVLCFNESWIQYLFVDLVHACLLLPILMTNDHAKEFVKLEIIQCPHGDRVRRCTALHSCQLLC